MSVKFNRQLMCFDRVVFTRWNKHARCYEQFAAIWLVDNKGEVYITFQRTDRKFARTIKVGETHLVGGSIREVYPAEDHSNPPKGWDHLPERRVITRPQIGGYESLRKEERRKTKIAARKRG